MKEFTEIQGLGCVFCLFVFFNLNPHLSVLRLVLYWKVFVNVNFNQNLSATLTIVKKIYKTNC